MSSADSAVSQARDIWVVESADPPRAQVHEAVCRGVQYLAFRATDLDLTAAFDPGTAKVPAAIVRAANAAVALHQSLLSPDLAASPTIQAARTARAALIGQLAEVRQRRPSALKVALRTTYISALAEALIEIVERDGPQVLGR